MTVVLPVFQEARHLGAVLDQLLSQDYPAERLEILIADGGAGASDDGTTAVAQAYARLHPERVRWLPNPERRASAGRNRGLEAARGEWVVFVDGHCSLPGASWLSESMRAAQRAGAVCLSRPQPLMAANPRSLQAVIADARATRIGHGADSTIYDARARGWVNPSSSGAAYHTSLLARVGRYDERFDACEDVEFNQRVAQLGVRAWLSPEAVVYYAARTSLAGLWRQMVRYGRGRVRLGRKHPQARTLAQTLPAAWLACLPLAVLGAWLAHGGWRWASLAGLAIYAGAVAGWSLLLAWRHGWRHLLAAPAVYFTIHAGLGAGAWRELAAPARANGLTGATALNANSATISAPRSSS
ncbi:MAG: glycosyltransferase family 2 protein [Terriglobales bacterium]